VAQAPYVSVVGPGDPSPEACRLAERLGAELARRGAVVVCGGLGGAMEAACRGAKSAGGTTVGILPGLDRSGANPYVDIAIATGMGELRNGLVVRAADAVVAVQGEYGTLSEISFALKVGVPVVGLDTWELVKGGRESGAIVRAASPEEAAEQALQLSARGGAGPEARPSGR
jgi:uncharacterized protein (TIGR00725 family)